MISTEIPGGLTSKEDRLRFITSRLRALAAAEEDALANLCNFVAYMYCTLGDVNWVGLYIRRGDFLTLGPFAGKPACTRIAVGKGVCGACAAELKTQLVPDVEKFHGHIACDSSSRSEIVLPLFVNGRLWGVLDIDSPVLNRFDEADAEGLSAAARLIEAQAASL